jgi:hypothetical protein
VGAPRDAAALELGQVAAGGHRRDAEQLLDLGHRDRARGAHAVGDRAPARLGQYAGTLV